MEDLYIIPIKDDKPVKIIIENEPIVDCGVERYKKTPREVLRDELKYNSDLRRQLTRQQIHSEYGKLKSNNCKEVVNFLLKRGITTSELNQKINEVHERHIIQITTKYGVSLSDNVFGSYKIENTK